MTGDPFYRSPPPQLLADRCMKARTSSRCALDACWISVGTRIGRLPDGRWAAVACIVRANRDVPAQGGAEQKGSP